MVLERFACVLGLLGSSCGSRGVCRERLGGVLEASRRRFGGSWGSLACVLGCLGAFLTRLVVILGTSWGVLGASCA